MFLHECMKSKYDDASVEADEHVSIQLTWRNHTNHIGPSRPLLPLNIDAHAQTHFDPDPPSALGICRVFKHHVDLSEW